MKLNMNMEIDTKDIKYADGYLYEWVGSRGEHYREVRDQYIRHNIEILIHHVENKHVLTIGMLHAYNSWLV